MKQSYNKGFTLIEVMIVVVIVALLAIMTLINYVNVQRRSRDARRKGDLKLIQNAIEQYYSICNYYYPTPAPGNKVSTSIVCGSTSIMASVPRDPRTATSYSMTGTASTYSICAPNSPPLETETGTYCLTQVQ